MAHPQITLTTSPAPSLPQARSDEHLIATWLHGRSPHTVRAYDADVAKLRSFLSWKQLSQVTLPDLQAFADSLAGLRPTSQCRVLSAVKSLLSFGQRVGYLSFNVGAPLRLPAHRNSLAERILSENQVHTLLHCAPGRRGTKERNRVLLLFLYVSGARVSEVTRLRWRDLQAREHGGQVTLFGKGGKTRSVLLPVSLWRRLERLRGEAGPDEPVFRSLKGQALDRSQVLRIVRGAAKRAGVEAPVSPHWLRHAHASHALDRGCPISLVKETLGHASVATTNQYLHARPGDSSARYLGV